LIDIVSVDNRNPEVEEANLVRLQHITNAWRERNRKTAPSISEAANQIPTPQRSPKTVESYHAALLQQTKVLTARTWTVTLRDPMGMLGSLIEAVAMAVIMGWVSDVFPAKRRSANVAPKIFYDLDGSQAGIRSRQGAVYTAAALQGYLILLYETYRLTTDIQVFDEEARQGVVGVPAFLISRRLAKLLIEDVPVPLIFSLIFYFMAGFRADGSQFLTFFGVILLEQYIAVCFATTCIAVSRNFAGASLVANLAYTLQSVACGYFIQANTLPVYVRWTKWTAYVVSLTC
jgi:hypothetical protein